MKKVLGDFPNEKQQIKQPLRIGMNDVDIIKKVEKSELETNEITSEGPNEIASSNTSLIRFKVRYKTENQEEANSLLKMLCNTR